MIFSHSKRFGIRDTSAVVTLGKASVTATCHARNPLFFNPYFFTVSLVTDNVLLLFQLFLQHLKTIIKDCPVEQRHHDPGNGI